MTSEGLLFTAVCDTNAASPSLGGAAIISFGRCINLVGYTGKDAREGYNWYAPHFFDVGMTTTDINAINLNDGLPHGEGAVGWGDAMQIVGPGGNPEAGYFYWDKSMDMSGTVTTDFFWSDDTGFPVDVKLAPGAGICIDNANGLTFDITIDCPYSL